MTRLFLSWLYYCLRCAFASIANVKLALSANVLLFKKNLNNLVILLILIMENEIYLYSSDSFVDQTEQLVKSDQKLVKDSLYQILGKKDLRQNSINSVKKLSAQIAGLCESLPYKTLFNSVNSLLSASNSELSTYEKAIIELQFLYGLRISEVLNINHTVINFNGSIQIKGLKGSYDRLVFPVKFRDFWLYVKDKEIQFSDSFNRFYFYRLYKKKGIYEIVSNNKKSSVTHILRYLFIVNLLKSGNDIHQIQQLLGHKSIKSTIHYVRNLL